MDLPQSMPQGAGVPHYKLMDFSDISSDLPDILTTRSHDDILDLVDILDSEHLDNIQHGLLFALTFHLTQPEISNTKFIYIYI